MTPEQIAAGAACFQCLNEDQKRAAVLYLLDNLSTGGGGGSGTVTSVSVTTANGVSGSVATATTTPAISLTLGAITPASAAFTGTAGNGFVSILSQSATPTAPASGFVEFADSTGRKSWRRASDGFVRTWDATLTADRVFTLPDATTTIAGLSVAQTFSAANTFSANGALSAPAVSFTGTPITGGTTTTTKPLVLIETSGATSTAWDTAGTGLGINLASGFAGQIFEFQLNGITKLKLSTGGILTSSGAIISGGLVRAVSSQSLQVGTDTFLSRKAAANFQLGDADAAAPVAQTLSVQSVVAGTTDAAGANWTLNGSRGTGTGAGGDIVFQGALAGSTGSSQNALTERFRIRSSGGVGIGSGGPGVSPFLFPVTGVSSTYAANGTALCLYGYGTGAGDAVLSLSGAVFTATSGATYGAYISKNFAPTSGTATHAQLTIAPTINQTGGANGITRGLYIAPTLTSAADFRALEISAGKSIIATSGAASEPAWSFTGTPFTGGSSTTTKPLVLIETSGATSTAWSTSGTMLGVNAPSGFAGRIADFQINGSSYFSLSSTGNFTLLGSGAVSWSSDTFITRKAAANLQIGAADAASPVAQTLSVQSVVAGTSNTAGANWTLVGSKGTGNAASGTIIFQLGTPAASGTSQHAASTGLTLSNVGTGGTADHRAVFTGTVATAGYTVATLPAAGTAGRRAYVTDATAPTYLGTLTGGGSVVCPVFDNGTTWVSA